MQLLALRLTQRCITVLARLAILRHPVAQRAGVDPQPAGHLSDRLPGLPDNPNRALLELRIELPSRLLHRPPPLASIRGRVAGSSAGPDADVPSGLGESGVSSS